MPSEASDFVQRFRAEILGEWQRLASTLPAARQMSAGAVLDHMPQLLQQIAELAEAIASRGPLDDGLSMARKHASDRLRAGFDISALIEEMSMLRESVMSVWTRHNATGDLGHLRALNHAIDKAIAVSVEAYAEARERVLAKLESLLAASPVGIAFVDRDLRYVRINDALATVKGIPARDHIGKTVGEVSPALEQPLTPLLKRVLETGQARMNLPITTPDGRALLGSYFPVRNSAGDIVGVGGIVMDVTEERRTQDALRAEQARLQSILEHSPAAIWVKDMEGRVLVANERLARALGHSLADVLGRSSDELLPPALAEQHRRHDQMVMRDQRAIEVEEETSAGTYLSVKFPIPSDPPLVGGIATEITERKKMEDELRAAVRTREDLLAVVSHDLRGPLGTIQLSVSMLQTQPQDPRARRHLEIVHRASLRMESLINDLLDSANIRTGRLVLETSAEAGESVLDEALELQQLLADEKSISLVRDAELAGVTIQCDRERVLQVFGNLIGNALKFCKPGDTITVRGAREGDYVRFSVEDTGPGIQPAELPRLFDPYWSAEEHARHGSGLGLYISRGIVEGHGGRIWVESTVGHGARFHFTLPVVAVESHPGRATNDNSVRTGA